MEFFGLGDGRASLVALRSAAALHRHLEVLNKDLRVVRVRGLHVALEVEEEVRVPAAANFESGNEKVRLLPVPLSTTHSAPSSSTSTSAGGRQLEIRCFFKMSPS